MKRILVLLVSAALVAGGLYAVPVAAQEVTGTPDAPAGDEVTFFLRSTGCSAADTNSDYLSVVDADDEIECMYTASGLRNEIGASQPAPPLAPAREDATRYWDSTDGGPIVLDATRAVTGKIFTAGAACVTTATPCSPVPLSVGEVILDITLVGKSRGKEIELGTQTETFNEVPGAPHETAVKIEPDATHAGKTFEVIELRTWIHGKSVGHGVIKTNGDYSSFISVPTAAEESNKKDGKKNGCKKAKKGKGKKRGCEGRGKKRP